MTTPRSGRIGSSAGTATPLMSSSKPKKRCPAFGSTLGRSRRSDRRRPCRSSTRFVDASSARASTRCIRSPCSRTSPARNLTQGSQPHKGLARAARRLDTSAVKPLASRPRETREDSSASRRRTPSCRASRSSWSGCSAARSACGTRWRPRATRRASTSSTLSPDDLLRHRPAARALVEELDGIVHEIEESGAHLKDVQLGLVDFPSERDGEIVYLCWQFGEPEIAFWHRVEDGFAGRQPLPGLDAAALPPVSAARPLRVSCWRSRCGSARSSSSRSASRRTSSGSSGRSPPGRPWARSSRRTTRSAWSRAGVALVGALALGRSAAAPGRWRIARARARDRSGGHGVGRRGRAAAGATCAAAGRGGRARPAERGVPPCAPSWQSG